MTDAIFLLVFAFVGIVNGFLIRRLDRERARTSYQRRRFIMANQTAMAIREIAYSMTHVRAGEDYRAARDQIEHVMQDYLRRMRELTDKEYPA